MSADTAPHAPGEEAPSEEEPVDPLFGQAGKFSANWAKHDGVIGRASLRDIGRELPRLIALCVKASWHADRRGTAIVAACELAIGAFTAFGLLAVNGVLRAVLAQSPTPERIHAAIPAVLLAGGAAAAVRLLSDVSAGESTRLKPRVQTYAQDRLYALTNEVELLAFDQADFKNLLEAAGYGSTWIPQAVDKLVDIVTAVMSLIAIGGVLAVLHPVLLALLPMIVLPGGYAAIRRSQRTHRSWQGTIVISRQQRMLAGLLTDSGAAEENRVHGVGAFVMEHYRRLTALVLAERDRLARIQIRSALMAGGATGAANAAAYVTLYALLMAGTIALAAAGTAAYALRTGTAQLMTLVSRLSSMYEIGLYVRDWDQACVLAAKLAIPGDGVPVEEPPSVIEARDVGFTYPDADKPALSGVNITILRGQTVALVGENGSGKSTLARVLCGLYPADDGEVFWNGFAVSSLDRRSMFGFVALLSQAFYNWPFVLKANVHVGRPDRNIDDQAFAAAIVNAGAQFAYDLPHREMTLLSKDFSNGVRLSGGQWQKVALARSGHYRDADLVILDEPTAALDPQAEVDTFNTVATLLRGKTTLLITHRLASVRNADVIHVLHEGRVVETGTFDQLMAGGQRFARLYRLQAAQYQAPTPTDGALL